MAGYKIPNDFDPKGYGVVLEIGRFFSGKKGKDAASDEEDKHFGDRRPRRGGAFSSLSGLLLGRGD